VTGGRVYGAVMPLVTNASGAKFGKSEGGNIWLDRELTSPYSFYQFWVNTEDADAVRYLKYFTLMDRERIAELADAVEREPHRRAAQKALAEEVTERVHGATGLAEAQRATDAFFGGSLEGLSAAEITDIFADVPSTRLSKDAFAGEGFALVDLLVEAGVASSKGDARRAIDGGGVYVNNVRADSVEARVGVESAIEGRYLVIRKGKRSYHVVELLD
jgi:tyrosyl-tRNA synthetase